MRNSQLLAFTLAEVMVAVIVVALLLSGATKTLQPYISQLRWRELRYSFGKSLNLYSMQSHFKNHDLVNDSSTLRYFWYLPLGSEKARWFLFKAEVQDENVGLLLEEPIAMAVDQFSFRLDQVFLNDDLVQNNAILLSWELGWPMVTFQLLDESLSFEQQKFNLPSSFSACSDWDKECSLDVFFVDFVSGQTQRVQVDRFLNIFWSAD